MFWYFCERLFVLFCTYIMSPNSSPSSPSCSPSCLATYQQVPKDLLSALLPPLYRSTGLASCLLAQLEMGTNKFFRLEPKSCLKKKIQFGKTSVFGSWYQKSRGKKKIIRFGSARGRSGSSRGRRPSLVQTPFFFGQSFCLLLFETGSVSFFHPSQLSSSQCQTVAQHPVKRE